MGKLQAPRCIDTSGPIFAGGDLSKVTVVAPADIEAGKHTEVQWLPMSELAYACLAQYAPPSTSV
jgi:hypothetical protein